MRKLQTLLLMLLAMLVLGGILASAALAEHQWLDLAGKALTEAHEATGEGVLVLHHKPPAILGGGTILVECTGQARGTVGPGSEGLVTLVLGLIGAEQDLGKCEVTSSTNSICPAGEKIEKHAIHLPWKTTLVLINSITFGEVFGDGHGEPGIESICKSINFSCTGKERAKWDENTPSGALFLDLGEILQSCSDGGTSTLLGHGVISDYFVS